LTQVSIFSISTPKWYKLLWINSCLFNEIPTCPSQNNKHPLEILLVDLIWWDSKLICWVVFLGKFTLQNWRDSCTSPEQSMPSKVFPPQRYGTYLNFKHTSIQFLKFLFIFNIVFLWTKPISFLTNIFAQSSSKSINCKLEFKNNLKITFDLKLGSLKTKAKTLLIL
jgi:hypothetical protein